jgi:hypothetical protein
MNFICRMIGLWICCMNFHITYQEFLVHCYWDMSYDLNVEGYDNLTQTQLWKTLLFHRLIVFRDVSTTKKPMWSNLDICRRSLVHTTVVDIRLWVFNFFSWFEVFIFSPLDCFNVIEISINFVKVGPVQVLPTDWWAGDVWPTNSSISLWW